MTTIAFANGKGGAGKTTVTMCVAMALSGAGKRVAVADRDPQGTSLIWTRQVATANGPFIYEPGQLYDVILIDTPPRLDSPEVRSAIEQADKTILVTSPSPTDLWTTRATADLVAAIRGPNSRIALLFNQVQTGTVLCRELDHLAEKVGVKPLFNNIRRRQCYQHASILGWSALPLRAQEEIIAIVSDIAAL